MKKKKKGHPTAPEMIVWKFMFNGRLLPAAHERTRLIIRGADAICMSRASFQTGRKKQQANIPTLCK